MFWSGLPNLIDRIYQEVVVTTIEINHVTVNQYGYVNMLKINSFEYCSTATFVLLAFSLKQLVA